jgi:hypothetical protein
MPTGTPRAPTPTPRPTSTPRSTPTPTRQPPPTPVPSPTPCLAQAPELVGQRRNVAASLWSDAGFTGAVTFQPGNGNYVIGSADRTVGQAYPCDSTVTVGP